MFAPTLLALALASTASDDAASLIGRLAAESFDDRVAAYKALERLGGEALPALRSAANSGDSRIRDRTRALIDSIGLQVEADRFRSATLVRLDFHGRALGEVVDALNERQDLGLLLKLGPDPPRGMIGFDPQTERLKALRERVVDIEADHPVPFWEAVDRICKAGSLRYEISRRGESAIGSGPVALLADRTGRGPASDSGPFRVQVLGAHSTFESDFLVDADPAGAGKKGAGLGNLSVPLAVLPEPGLMVYENGAAIIAEATDDLGRSLVPGPAGAVVPAQVNRSRQMMGYIPPVRINVSLETPSPAGTKIRRLRGKLPVIVVAKALDPIVVPLEGKGASGPEITTRDMTMCVEDMARVPGTPPSVRVTFRFDQGALAPGSRVDPIRPDFATFNRDRAMERLELRDAGGRRLEHTLDGQTRGADGRGFYDSYRLSVRPRAGTVGPGEPRKAEPPIPADVRFYSYVQSTQEIPFDFQDLPLP